ncbi:MAG: DUF3160 domain-containing protein [Candidatus Margulisiibacteriota bacterium]
MRKKKFIQIGIFTSLALILVLGISFLILARGNAKPVNPNTQNLPFANPYIGYVNHFAHYEDIPVNITPNVTNYTIKPDLSNVTNYVAFEKKFSEKGLSMLAKNAFVVLPRGWDEFFALYENNRYDFVPNFVTTDALLHNYHLVFNKLLEDLEVEQFIPTLKVLNSQLLSTALEQYKKAQNTSWQPAAQRNLAFIAVGSYLLDPTVSIPLSVKPEVEEELALIKLAQGISASPIMNSYSKIKLDSKKIYLEDYSQYIPRSHYNKNENLKKYFKCMMWYGRINFVFSNPDSLKSAALLTLALNQNGSLSNWEKLFEPITFLVGKTDDPTYYDMQPILTKLYGQDWNIDSLLKNTDKYAELEKKVSTLTPPQINSIPIYNAKIEPDRNTSIVGFRIMGQRFTVDASILQRLVYREVDDRYLPKALDVPAALGNDEALKILDEMGENKYPNYAQNMQNLRVFLPTITQEVWTQNLYWSWLYTLLPLNQPKGAGFPFFMQNTAWARKEINTFLGSYTELKHDTILYAKQVYAEMGGGEPEKKDDRGYVEPNPWLFGRLASLVKITKQGLANRGLLSDKINKTLSIMEEMALKLKTISEKELTNQNLNDDDYELIRSFGGQIEHLWVEIYKDDFGSDGQQAFLDGNPAALVTDIATDPNGRVLEEGIGKIFEIYVLVPLDGKLRLTKGGVFSYYEFTRPLSGRLTDEEWRGIVKQDSEKAEPLPPSPNWTKSFIHQE